MRVIGGVLGALAASLLVLPAFADVAKGISLLETGDVQGSVKEFQAAFEAGDSDGAFYLGRLFELGLGTEKDMRRAAELYAASASKGSALAQNRLGLMHLNGEFVLQDYARAAELICAAAEQGDANGAFNCGLLYSEGKGVSKDAERAFALWRVAAEAKHVAAINFLGQAYRDGVGVAKDDTAAFAQFSVTAAAGNPLGLFEVAKASASGTGTDIDLIKAYAYSNLAAVRGMTDAGDQAACDRVKDKLVQFGMETAFGMTLGQFTPGDKIGMKLIAWMRKHGDEDVVKAVDEAVDVANSASIGGKTCVYSCIIDGTTRYVGITDDVARRGAQHLRTKGIEIEQIAGLDNISRADARAVEQTLINYYGLGKDGGDLLNKINSISSTRNPTTYEQALIRGKELLDSVDYQWTK